MDYSEDIDYRSFRSKCKLCLETLLEQEKENNVTSDVEKKIFEIFPSNLYPFGNLSSLLCDHCFAKIDDISIFRDQIIQRQEGLKNDFQPFVEVKIKLESEDMDSIIFESVVVKAEDEEMFEEKSNIIKEEIKDERDEIFGRGRLTRKAKSLSLLKLLSKKKPKERQKRVQEFYHCEFCDIVMNRNILYRHMNTEHKEQWQTKRFKFECDFCDERFSSKKNITKHLSIHKLENREKAYPCNKCKESFPSIRRLYNHKTNVHGEKPTESFSCHCGATFLSTTNMERHINTAHRKKQHPCKFCDKTFFDPFYVAQHITTCHNPLNIVSFVCTKCGKTFPTKKYFNHHMRRHNKAWICKKPGCNRRFSSKADLLNHFNRSHVATKDFKCSYKDCDKAYSAAFVLRQHIYNNHMKAQQNCPVEGCDYKNHRKEYMKFHINNRHKDLGAEGFQKLLECVRALKFELKPSNEIN